MAVVATLTQSQKDLLVWIVEVGSGEAVWSPTNSPEDILSAPDGTKRTVNSADMHELVSLGLLHQIEGQRHGVTSSGRDVYEQIKNPPPDREPPGFQHP